VRDIHHSFLLKWNEETGENEVKNTDDETKEEEEDAMIYQAKATVTIIVTEKGFRGSCSRGASE